MYHSAQPATAMEAAFGQSYFAKTHPARGSSLSLPKVTESAFGTSGHPRKRGPSRPWEYGRANRA